MFSPTELVRLVCRRCYKSRFDCSIAALNTLEKLLFAFLS